MTRKHLWEDLNEMKLPLNMTFEMNGVGYRTDLETLKVLRSMVVSSKKKIDKYTMVAFVMYFGLGSGRIEEIESHGEQQQPRQIKGSE